MASWEKGADFLAPFPTRCIPAVYIVPNLNMYFFSKTKVGQFCILARLRRPTAAFLLNWAITRPATGTITCRQTYPSYMQSFIKIRGAVLEKNGNNPMTLCNFNKDVLSLKGSVVRNKGTVFCDALCGNYGNLLSYFLTKISWKQQFLVCSS